MLIKFPIFVARTDSTISVAAIFVAVMCAVIFKDAFKRILSSPSPLKIAIIALAFSYIATSIGSQIMILSITAVASGVAALPLNMWYGMLIAPQLKSELQAMLEVSKNEKEKHSTNNQELFSFCNNCFDCCCTIWNNLRFAWVSNTLPAFFLELGEWYY